MATNMPAMSPGAGQEVTRVGNRVRLRLEMVSERERRRLGRNSRAKLTLACMRILSALRKAKNEMDK